jgi:hypothetical protein
MSDPQQVDWDTIVNQAEQDRLREGSRAINKWLRQRYTELQEDGFTEPQAIYMTGQMAVTIYLSKPRADA